jgi:MFS family permease
MMQVIGMLVGGAIGDRYDKRMICAVCMLMHMAGMLLLTYATGFGMIGAFAVLHGLAWGVRGPLMQAIRADYFGRSNFGTIMGISTTIIMVGQIAGPLVAGIMADTTGDYVAGFTILAVLSGVGSGFFIFARRPSLPEPQAAPAAAAGPA